MTAPTSDNPVFFSKNYVDGSAEITVNTNQVAAYKLNDRDWIGRYYSVGLADDDLPAIIKVLFYFNGALIPRTVSDIILQNTNLRVGKIEYLSLPTDDPANWVTVSPDLGSGDYIENPFPASGSNVALQRAITPVNCYGIRVTINSTITPDQEKELGELLILNRLLDLSTAFSVIEPVQNPVVLLNQTANGGLNPSLIKWAGARTTRWSCRLSVEYLTKAYKDDLMDVLTSGLFVIWPEPQSNPGNFYLVTASHEVIENPYTADWKGAGYTMDFEVRES